MYQNNKTATINSLTCLETYASQPGAPPGAGGFLASMLARYRGINNKGVLDRPWTICKVLRAMSSTLRCQFTGNHENYHKNIPWDRNWEARGPSSCAPFFRSFLSCQKKTYFWNMFGGFEGLEGTRENHTTRSVWSLNFLAPRKARNTTIFSSSF